MRHVHVDAQSNGERNRGLYILKSRGMAHSNQIREFVLSANGIKLQDVVVDKGAVLVGSARMAYAMREQAMGHARTQEIDARRREAEQRRQAIEAQMRALQIEIENEEADWQRFVSEEQWRDQVSFQERHTIAQQRMGGRNSSGPDERQ